MHTTEESTASLTIGEVVAKDIRKAEIFKRNGIDFCCGGKKTIQQACEEAGVEEQKLMAELNKTAVAGQAPSMDFDSWSIEFLADYILNTHHVYVKSNIPLILELANKVANRHGDAHPETREVLAAFTQLANEMVQHMRKEEHILFPYIKQLTEIKKQDQKMAKSQFGSILNPIGMMEHEHEGAGNLLKLLARLTGNYTPPAEACNSYRLLYSKLQEFEADLHQHVHLENNILFPKSANLENELLS
ncbi:MAG TPA: iron-sulfur cluster repair di-iron protein [Bacteroidia bacterium]